MNSLREVFRGGGKGYAWCQFMTNWTDQPPQFIHVHDPKLNESFIAARRMGTWAEVDMFEVVRRLNGDWPEITVSQTPESVTPATPSDQSGVPFVRDESPVTQTVENGDTV